MALTALSGVAMRWRKIQADASIGYKDERQLLDLLAGGATAFAQVLALPKGAGVSNAVGKGGWLLSEAIAGRFMPGV